MNTSLLVVMWISIPLPVFSAKNRRLAGPEFGALGISLDSSLEANGTDTAMGFNAGLLFTPLERWNANGKPCLNMAFVYRSQVTLSLDGEFLVNGSSMFDASI